MKQTNSHGNLNHVFILLISRLLKRMGTYFILKSRGILAQKIGLRCLQLSINILKSNSEWSSVTHPQKSTSGVKQVMATGATNETSSGAKAQVYPKHGSSELALKVHQPPHYKKYQLEVINLLGMILRDHFSGYEGYCLGNTLKYLLRYKFKGDPIGDLNKAKAYIDFLIQVENENNGLKNGQEVL